MTTTAPAAARSLRADTTNRFNASHSPSTHWRELAACVLMPNLGWASFNSIVQPFGSCVLLVLSHRELTLPGQRRRL